ncbi:hypothetical protein [Arthrobacter dokdonensis]|uniref:hypothetical protein n=1 Tax=Arthrobacter dokdonellae TaxID=2211210 RepID=UPI001013C4CE|nr:hypothetical protein [Arthrobacter dokdonellae]
MSVVSEKWQDAPRPDGHEKQLGECDDGWLVRTTPLADGLRVHRERAAGLTAESGPGPQNAAGKPLQRYISALTEEEGQALLHECGVTAPQSSAGSLRGLPGSAWGADEPDQQTPTTIRLEQAYLRKNLLRGRLKAPCAICGDDLTVVDARGKIRAGQAAGTVGGAARHGMAELVVARVQTGPVIIQPAATSCGGGWANHLQPI